MDKVRTLLGELVPEYATTRRPAGRATPAAGEKALELEGATRSSGSSRTIPN
jgi:hypothetical protein